MKKVNGSLKQSHYEVIDYDTGEVVDLKPEYTTMSRRPGIAGCVNGQNTRERLSIIMK
jgi:hypothetical protein